MWGKSKEIKDLQEKLATLELRVEQLAQSVASMRGMLNRKLYSGKLDPEEPDWLQSNLGMLGAREKNKSSGGIGN